MERKRAFPMTVMADGHKGHHWVSVDFPGRAIVLVPPPSRSRYFISQTQTNVTVTRGSRECPIGWKAVKDIKVLFHLPC